MFFPTSFQIRSVRSSETDARCGSSFEEEGEEGMKVRE
jgi:hypothetical protein